MPVTMPGIPSGGNFGYAATQDSLVYDPATHIGGPPLPAGIDALISSQQNQLNNLIAATDANMENGTTTNWVGQGGALANVTTGPAHSGTHAMRYTGTGVIANGNLIYAPNGNLGVNIAAYLGYQLSMSAWCYNPAAPLRMLRMVCAFYTSGGVLITPTYTGPLVPEVRNTWMLAPPLNVVVPPTATYVTVYCGGFAFCTTGEVRYFDDYALAPL